MTFPQLRAHVDVMAAEKSTGYVPYVDQDANPPSQQYHPMPSRKLM